MILIIAGVCLVALIEALLLVAQETVLQEVRLHLKATMHDRDLARQEVQVLTDAIARSNNTPILRSGNTANKVLEKSETYWEVMPDILISREAKHG